MKLFSALLAAMSGDEGCDTCPDKDAQIARLQEMLRSKAIRTYPVIFPGQVHLADEIAFQDRDRPWRTVRGTIIDFGWSVSGAFVMTFAAGWTWTDHIAPSEELPHGHYKLHTASSAVRFELPLDKKLRLLARIDMT